MSQDLGENKPVGHLHTLSACKLVSCQDPVKLLPSLEMTSLSARIQACWENNGANFSILDISGTFSHGIINHEFVDSRFAILMETEHSLQFSSRFQYCRSSTTIVEET